MKPKPDRAQLAITMFMGMSFRNFISSGTFSLLAENQRICILTLSRQAALMEKIQAEGFRSAAVLPTNLFQKFISKAIEVVELAQYYLFFLQHRSATMLKYVERRNKDRQLKWIVAKLLARSAAIIRWQSLITQWPYSLISSKHIQRTLLPYESLLVLSTDLVEDKAFSVQAKRMGKKLFMFVHSWDNLPARGFLATKPDLLLVWNNEMKTQAKDLHGLSSENIAVVGVPQYDYYLEIAAKCDLRSALHQMGISDGEQFLTYTCSASRVFPDEEQFIDLAARIASNLQRKLVIRLHPTERGPQYRAKFGNDDRIIINEPSGEFAASTGSAPTGSKSDLVNFVALMKHSDVVINLASTTTLDANLFLTPVVCIAFNCDPSMNGAWNAAHAWYSSTHYDAIIKSGAIKVAYSAPELKKLITESLLTDVDMISKRRNLRDRFCPFLGASRERIAEVLNKENALGR